MFHDSLTVFSAKQPLISKEMAQSLAAETMDMARESSTSIKAYETAVEHMKMVKSYARPTGDIGGLFGVVRMESGLNYKNRESKGM